MATYDQSNYRAYLSHRKSRAHLKNILNLFLKMIYACWGAGMTSNNPGRWYYRNTEYVLLASWPWNSCGSIKRLRTTQSPKCKLNRVWNDKFCATNEFCWAWRFQLIKFNDPERLQWCFANKRLNFTNIVYSRLIRKLVEWTIKDNEG